MRCLVPVILLASACGGAESHETSEMTFAGGEPSTSEDAWIFLTTEFEGGRHIPRVDKIKALESAPSSIREVADQIAAGLGDAQTVQTIGRIARSPLRFRKASSTSVSWM